MNNIKGQSKINESLQTHFLIYKITNNVNGKYYIGQHKTEDPYDDYMGSGNLIKAAIHKYSLSCFTKEILFDFDNFEDMNNKEKQLVTLSTCYPNDPMSYNLAEGGHGGNNIRYDIPEIKNAHIQKIRQTYMNLSEDEKIKRHNMYSKSAHEAYNKRIRENPNYYKRSKKFKENLHNKRIGINNPMFSKKLKDCMSEDKYKEMCNKTKLSKIGRKAMMHPNIDGYKYIKPQDFQKYLDLGYTFKCNK